MYIKIIHRSPWWMSCATHPGNTGLSFDHMLLVVAALWSPDTSMDTLFRGGFCKADLVDWGIARPYNARAYMASLAACISGSGGAHKLPPCSCASKAAPRRPSGCIAHFRTLKSQNTDDFPVIVRGTAHAFDHAGGQPICVAELTSPWPLLPRRAPVQIPRARMITL